MSRDELAAALLDENIETKKYFYPPLHQQALYKEHGANLPVTEAIADSVLSLPIYESLPAATVLQVAGAIRGLARHNTPKGARAC